ncbi:hypothetical protein NG42_04100 [Winslowiella iniecta]|uniref:Uncharacterized protein n=1 Tax=Winslowiella iniecta TaxID=1560201 RepID=A0A0L7T9A1_9GAMM|nr:hypothetical protein NG42_04100 [Winslowiella iniecta]KOC94938.1 hypothetical protein NG43_01610 [Winslowiella iniecta]
MNVIKTDKIHAVAWIFLFLKCNPTAKSMYAYTQRRLLILHLIEESCPSFFKWTQFLEHFSARPSSCRPVHFSLALVQIRFYKTNGNLVADESSHRADNKQGDTDKAINIVLPK